MDEILNRWLTRVDWHNKFLYFGDLYARLAIVLLISFILGKLLGKILIKITKKSASSELIPFSRFLVKNNVAGRFAIMLPFIISYIISEFVFADAKSFSKVLLKFIFSALVALGVYTLNGFLDALDEYYLEFEAARTNPIKGYLQLIKIFFTLAGVIVIAATFLNRSPLVLLSGFGAMTALVALIFRDWILGLIASIQINANNLVVIGDSIEIEKYGVNGEVIEIALSTVKVRNWDNTISMIPAYSLISDTFKNWHGVKESGGRRIKRVIHIDMNSIALPDEKILRKMEALTLLKNTDELKELRKNIRASAGSRIDKQGLTNIGMFRKYVGLYLAGHHGINSEKMLMAKLMEPTVHGVPLQIYAFSNVVDVVEYERNLAEITEHLIAVLPAFGLRLFQNPSAIDI